jgi:hypothetical protein
MDVLKSKAMLKALKWILIKYGKIESVQAQEISVDVKSAPHAKHTISRNSWLHTRGPGVEIRKRASQFSLKLTKGENG